MAGIILQITTDYGKELITNKFFILDEVEKDGNTYTSENVRIITTDEYGVIIDQDKPVTTKVQFGFVKNFNIKIEEEE